VWHEISLTASRYDPIYETLSSPFSFVAIAIAHRDVLLFCEDRYASFRAAVRHVYFPILVCARVRLLRFVNIFVLYDLARKKYTLLWMLFLAILVEIAAIYFLS